MYHLHVCIHLPVFLQGFRVFNLMIPGLLVDRGIKQSRLAHNYMEMHYKVVLCGVLLLRGHTYESIFVYVCTCT